MVILKNMLILLLICSLKKPKSALTIEGDIEITAILFRINGDFNLNGEIRLRKTTSFSAGSIVENYDGPLALKNVIKGYC